MIRLVVLSFLFASALGQVCLEAVGGPWNIRSTPCGASIVGTLAAGEKTTLRPGSAPTTCTLAGATYDFIPVSNGGGWVASTALRACASACIKVKTAGASVRNSPCGTVATTLNSGTQKTLSSQTIQVAECSGKKYVWVSIAEGVLAAEFAESCNNDDNIRPPPDGGCNSNQRPTALGAKGTALIQKWEGLERCWYRDANGDGTICWGHLVVSGEPYGPGTCLTTAQCQALFQKDVPKYSNCVRDRVKVPLNQNQFDALSSFAFNVGCGGFADSTLLRLLNQGQYKEVCPQLKRWVNGANGPLAGLVSRRNEECSLFNSCDGIQRSGNYRTCPEADTCSSCLLNLGNDATFALYDDKNVSTACSQANWASLADDWCTNVDPWECYYATNDFGNGTACPACAPKPMPTINNPITPNNTCTDKVGNLCADNDCEVMLPGTLCESMTGSCLPANQTSGNRPKLCNPKMPSTNPTSLPASSTIEQPSSAAAFFGLALTAVALLFV